MSSYQYYMDANLTGYIGKWIAIVDNKIVSSGEDVRKVAKEVKKKFPKVRPLLTKVPNKEAMIF